MVHRTKDPSLVSKIVFERMGTLANGFDAYDWLQIPDNIALVSGPDLALFKGYGAGIFEGHWVFASRGRDALEKAKLMVRTLFNDHQADKVWGFTPSHCKAARIFNRKLCREIGGGSKGTFKTDKGWQELFVLVKTDWTEA